MKTSQSLKSSLSLLNKCCLSDKPIPISAADPMSDIYCHLSVSHEMVTTLYYLQDCQDRVPFSIRRRAIDSFNHFERSSEDNQIVSKEMDNFTKCYGAQVGGCAKCHMSAWRTIVSQRGGSPFTTQRGGTFLPFTECILCRAVQVFQGRHGYISFCELGVSDDYNDDDDCKTNLL